MNKKLMIIIAAILIVIAGGITAFLLLKPGVQPEEEDLFLPGDWQIDVEELKDAAITIYLDVPNQNDMEDVLEAVNRKLKDDLKTQLDFEVYWEYPAMFIDRVRTSNASGQPCDAYIYSTGFDMPVKTLVEQGLMMDLSELFPKYAPNYYNQFSRDEIKALTVDGGIYLIPPRIPSADIKYAVVRQDLMEKYNIPEISSYDDFEVYLETVKKNEPDMITTNYYDTSLGMFAQAYGYAILDRDMQLVYRWDDPEMQIMAWEQTPECLESLERLNGWLEKGYLAKTYIIAEIQNQMVTTGKWASFVCDPSNQMYFNSLLNSKGIKDISYRAYPLYDGCSARNPMMSYGLAVNGGSRQPERVLMFIDWLQSDRENYDLLMYGVKGTHYIDKGGYIEPAPDVAATFYEWVWKPPFENIDYQRTNYPGLEEEIDSYHEILAKRTKFPAHFGFIPDYSSVYDIATPRKQRSFELDDLVYRGSFSEVGLQKYRDEQKRLGVDSVIAEIQKQLDDYRAKNPG
ncbi:MAG: extracellular solute-binding protein [Clostridiaceae bacterium]|nr:extracellular solute-binding protein [Clostridiaceae bacterium]